VGRKTLTQSIHCVSVDSCQSLWLTAVNHSDWQLSITVIDSRQSQWLTARSDWQLSITAAVSVEWLFVVVRTLSGYQKVCTRSTRSDDVSANKSTSRDCDVTPWRHCRERVVGISAHFIQHTSVNISRRVVSSSRCVSVAKLQSQFHSLMFLVFAVVVLVCSCSCCCVNISLSYLQWRNYELGSP